ncbi:hypothetical protein GCM10010420_45750 [Streptomyces glaucosporus]|uniref:Uncharacterized protein n=1 Tax=Streptomyces glaucosporus TaxID=284044 RepID=A0ABP5VTK3_9ACTN
MDDQVAAEDGQAVVGALVAGVDGAVGVLDDVAGDELLLGAQAELTGLGACLGLGGLDRRRSLGRGQLDRDGAGLRRGPGAGRSGLQPGEHHGGQGHGYRDAQGGLPGGGGRCHSVSSVRDRGGRSVRGGAASMAGSGPVGEPGRGQAGARGIDRVFEAR